MYKLKTDPNRSSTIWKLLFTIIPHLLISMYCKMYQFPLVSSLSLSLVLHHYTLFLTMLEMMSAAFLDHQKMSSKHTHITKGHTATEANTRRLDLVVGGQAQTFHSHSVEQHGGLWAPDLWHFGVVHNPWALESFKQQDQGSTVWWGARHYFYPLPLKDWLRFCHDLGTTQQVCSHNFAIW